jgi:hypothetical protein
MAVSGKAGFEERVGGSRSQSGDIGHPRVVGDAPFHRSIGSDLRPEPRLDLRTGKGYEAC